jgi:hypothetical protein
MNTSTQQRLERGKILASHKRMTEREGDAVRDEIMAYCKEAVSLIWANFPLKGDLK